nr:hypothetical protein [Tanacetum cinerariifolium]
SERFPPALNTQNLDIHDGLKLFDCPSTGILSCSSYDDEYHGPDISNQEKEILVNPVTTKKRFQNQRVWVHVELPEGKHAIGTKWILKNKRDARGIVCKNKARLVAQGHRQEEGIDYNEVFAPVAQDWSDEFEALMQSQFKMSSIGQLTFFLGLQVDQRSDGIFIHQTKSMIGSLMYLIAFRPDITFAASACARNQVSLTVSNLNVVKRIFKYIKGNPPLVDVNSWAGGTLDSEPIVRL